MLTTTTGEWALALSQDDLAITVTGQAIAPESVSLDLVADPVATFGPPFTQA